MPADPYFALPLRPHTSQFPQHCMAFETLRRANQPVIEAATRGICKRANFKSHFRNVFILLISSPNYKKPFQVIN